MGKVCIQGEHVYPTRWKGGQYLADRSCAKCGAIRLQRRHPEDNPMTKDAYTQGWNDALEYVAGRLEAEPGQVDVGDTASWLRSRKKTQDMEGGSECKHDWHTQTMTPSPGPSVPAACASFRWCPKCQKAEKRTWTVTHGKRSNDTGWKDA